MKFHLKIGCLSRYTDINKKNNFKGGHTNMSNINYQNSTAFEETAKLIFTDASCLECQNVFSEELLKETKKLAEEYNLTATFYSFLDRVNAVLNWKKIFSLCTSDLIKYKARLRKKIYFAVINKCYNQDFPCIEGKRKGNEKIYDHFKHYRSPSFGHESENIKNYYYGCYFAEHWIPYLISKCPEFTLIFRGFVPGNIEQSRIPEEHIRIAKLNTRTNPANKDIATPKFLEYSLHELYEYGKKFYLPEKSSITDEERQEEIWKVLGEANFKNVYYLYQYMYAYHDDPALLSLHYQIFASCFCGGREHSSSQDHALFHSSYDSIKDLQDEYLLIQQQCLTLESLNSWVENEFLVSNKNG